MAISLKKDDCTGCGACIAVCNKGALEMIKGEHGFMIASINSDLCVECGLCQTICNRENDLNPNKQAYILRHGDYDVYSKSQSGGAFSLISDYFISNHGVVYAAALNDAFRLTHIRAEDELTRNKMRGSVYIQSEAYRVYKLVAKDLKDGRLVLFVGTPCQVSALKKYIGLKRINDDKLYIIDLLCHGVGSSVIWNKVIEYYRNKYKSDLEKIELSGCDKEIRPYFSFKYADNQISDSVFKRLYYSNLGLRSSCYKCEFNKLERAGDFSIGDASRVEEVDRSFYSPKGTSLLLLNTEKGIRLFDYIKSNSKYKAVDIKDYMQECLYKGPSIKRSREEFWNDIENKSFGYVIEKYVNHNIFLNIKYIVRRIIKSKNI